MKTKIAFIAASLAVLASPLRADIVEANVTIALKFYANTTDSVEKGNSEILNYQTGTIKNSDIIEAVNFALFEDEADDYSPKSKIIRQDEFNDNGSLLATRYLIRDKAKEADLDVTNLIDIDSLEEVVKYKFSTVTGAGTVNLISNSRYQFLFDPESPETSEELDLFGIDRSTIKVVMVKSTENFVDLLSFSSKVSGYGYFFPLKFDDFYEGIAEGTIKVSGAKVFPTPPDT
ncbi:hypothetical protein WJU23_16570 [Prosthecobacter sp. SYSU 5D2]|uniref:hypothetical protein n=1 Tax=Prosthecobacter sp. SYSU 5D2 TaxID=3134134 RepID=UPI0031FE88A2